MIKTIYGKPGKGRQTLSTYALDKKLKNNEITAERYVLIRLLYKLEGQQENEYNKRLIQDIKQKLKTLPIR